MKTFNTSRRISLWSQQISCHQSSHICVEKLHNKIPRTERQDGTFVGGEREGGD